MAVESPNLCIEHITNYIIHRHEQSATLAAREPDNDGVIEEAIYYDNLYNYPTPGESKDDAGLPFRRPSYGKD